MADAFTADAIIIGGGVHGSSLAFHLAERGLKPVVLERRFLGAEATGRSSGLVRMHYDLEPESRLAWISFQYFIDWAERVGGACGFTRTGFLQIVKREHAGQLRANVAMHQGIGIPSLVVTAEDVRRLAPGLFTDDFEIAAYEPESGYADPTSTARAFMETAQSLGARLVQDCRVTGVTTQGGSVTGIQSNRGDFSGPVVVNAAGAWAARIGRMVGLDLPVDTWRHDTMFIRRPDALRRSHPAVIDFQNEMYFRPETGRLTLVGLEDGNPIGEDPEDQDERARPGFIERAIERICRRFPGMEYGSLHSAHGGYDGITPDQRAILDQAGPDGFYLVCGFSGTGFKIAPAVGACMSERILDGAAKTVDIAAFGLDRFSNGRRLTGEYGYENVWH
jgi:glycine/D-amino acid oxidase-like deaminating enzyme